MRFAQYYKRDEGEGIWFKLAKAHAGIVWTKHYDYAGDPGRGLTVCKAVRAAGAHVD